MSKFSEVLTELLEEHNLNRKTFAANVGISASRVSDYIRNDKLPTLENLIKIADYFQCSTDFLLGREYEETHEIFHDPIPFSERIRFLKEQSHFSHKDIYETVGKSRYFEWLNGKRQPSLDHVILLADLFGCSVDYLLGRER